MASAHRKDVFALLWTVEGGYLSALFFEIRGYVGLFVMAVKLPFDSRFNNQQYSGPRKNKVKMLIEIVSWAIKYKELCDWYYLYGLDVKGRNPQDYLSYTEFRVIRNILNIRQRENINTKYTFNYLSLVRDKFVFYQYLDSLHMPHPKTIALVQNGKIWYYENGKEILWEDITSILKHEIIGFAKETTGEGGKGAFSIHIANGNIMINKENASIENLQSRFAGSTYIIQELLVNHSSIRRIYPLSLNTIRLVTTLNRDGSVDFFSAIHRFGANGSVVDNGCNGGLLIKVNEQGVLGQTACFEPHTHFKKLIVQNAHPNTQTIFAGVQLPYWDDILSTAKNLHKFFYGIPSIGWDIAITENGFCFTEAGEDWEIAMDQAVNGGQRKHFMDSFSYALEIPLRKY